MNFPQFWARGQTGDFFSWRWSSKSVEEAQKLADDAAQNLAQRHARGEMLPNPHGYYPGRPFREQLLREVKNGAGETIAVITRNSYGCLVLNTSRVMFVDIDLPEPKRRSGGFLKKLFGKPDLTPPEDPAKNALAKVETWTRNQDGWGWRIYRTRAGLRLLATHALFDPEAVASNGIFTALGADPLYTRLCKTQKCFRARLSPKPWRCGVFDKPDRWPFLTPNAEARFQKWERQYQSESTNWATTALVRNVGMNDVHPDVQTVISIHDESTRAESKMELA